MGYRQSIFPIDILTRRRSKKKTFFTGVHGEGVIKCALQGQKNAFFSTFWINFMECHSIQFTTISINVERGIVKILFKYRYFQDLLIDIDIDKEILKISIFKEDLNNTPFYIYGYCGELYRMTFHKIYPKKML